MAKQTDFNSFLSDIQPSKSTVEYISSIQKNMRKYLKEHEVYKTVHIDTFLSGSYAKNTSIRPVVGDNKRDVDIVVVTSYSTAKDSKEVLDELKEVLTEKEIYKNATVQSHSIGIEMGSISVDVVPVIASNNDSLYYIGDSNTGEWVLTDPKGHKEWSTEVNSNNSGEYKPLVKIFKWWRRNNCPQDIKYPKGITLEKIVADNLGDSSLSTEDFLIETMQNIISAYKEEYVEKNTNPVIDDPSEKIENNDLLAGYSVKDFSEFISKLEEHVKMLNDEGVENDVWKKVLGDAFPSASLQQNNSYKLACVQKCITASHKQPLKWPIQRGSAVFISLKVTGPNGENIAYENNGTPLVKECDLNFTAITGVKRPFRVVWQIVNTGAEAEKAKCLRGGFEESNVGMNGRKEKTSYNGSHLVQCFVIKKGICIAKSQEFIINILG